MENALFQKISQKLMKSGKGNLRVKKKILTGFRNLSGF
jgi:hypothetical protein